MKVHRFDFDSAAEAQAFIDGMDLANDSDLDWHAPIAQDGGYTGYVHDECEDYEGQNEACPACKKKPIPDSQQI